MRPTEKNRGNRSLLLRFAPLIVASGLLVPQYAYTKTIGPTGDRYLDSMSAVFDTKGIDVVPSYARDFDFKTETRPRLARLGGFPVSLDQPQQETEDWMRQFRRGAFDYVTAFRPAGDIPEAVTGELKTKTFLKEWDKAPAEERVFIAFTREDRSTARKVADVLRAEGLVVFTYLEDSRSSPWAKPEIVGRLFREAGQHFVIDSQRARLSSGVAFEALNYDRLKTVTRRAQPSRKRTCAEIFGGL